ncbi:FadR/GntR family transcriptional regulator [Paraburkholderia bannensis]|uniref:FadR/GntR family transcriptional regulator n=1 Tax=Paraburkholderia bannensis TaxID=765414 RepID=UPI002AC35AC7|nr:FadR/GntR family transcriptional regulator [Paraburkholderia bannensis]
MTVNKIDRRWEIRRGRLQSLPAVVIEHIRRQIEGSALNAGEKIPSEIQLMAAFQVSRSVVREALSQLQASGAIFTRHGVGSFVAEDRSDGVLVELAEVGWLDAMEVRMGCEPECASLASQRASPEELARIKSAYQLCEFAAEAQQGSAEANFRFHVAIAHATGNRHFVEILNNIRYRAKSSAQWTESGAEDAVQQMLVERAGIMEAIERRDSDRARAAMRAHLYNSLERLRQIAGALR